MTTNRRTSIAAQLNAARVVICNTQADGELLARVERFGYTADRLSAGQQLLDAAAAAVNVQVSAAGAQRLATARACAAERQAHASYQALARLARAVFQYERGFQVVLGLGGEMPRDTAGFLFAAHMLFRNARASPRISATLRTTATTTRGSPRSSRRSRRSSRPTRRRSWSWPAPSRPPPISARRWRR